MPNLLCLHVLLAYVCKALRKALRVVLPKPRWLKTKENRLAHAGQTSAAFCEHGCSQMDGKVNKLCRKLFC